MASQFSVLKDSNYRRFIIGYGISFVMYWVTLLAIGWWTWEVTRSATWVGFMFFCDLLPAVILTPFASAMADRGDRFTILKTVLYIQVVTGFTLAMVAAFGLLTPQLLAGFVAIEGLLVGCSQPAFFGLVNRLVTKENLSAAVGFNSGVIQTSYILGPLIAGLLFSFGLEIAPLAFAANAGGTVFYIWALSRITLQPQPDSQAEPEKNAGREILEGLTVLWNNGMIFRCSILILAVAILQRPLLNLMPAINDYYELFTSAYFTIMTASYMGGAVVASLILAYRNSDEGLYRLTVKAVIATFVFYCALFIVTDLVSYRVVTAMSLVFLLGVAAGFVWTGNMVILQNRTPEHLRSRVLGNNFMVNRTLGAVSVVLCGLSVDAFGLANGMLAAAVFVMIALPIMHWLNRLVVKQPQN